MNLRRALILSVIVCLMISGCVARSGVSGNLGISHDRRVVIVGDNVSEEIALYYQRRYDAMVWFTQPKDRMADAKEFVLKGFGPSYEMQSLINELKSINYTFRRWEIIVPKTGESYFLATLKYMDTSCLAHARGNIVLTDSKGNKDMEAQVARVTNGSFFVTYEFQKY